MDKRQKEIIKDLVIEELNKLLDTNEACNIYVKELRDLLEML
jgi:hypothetical protein